MLKWGMVSYRRRYLPEVIKGDLDSVRRETADFYAQLGTRSLSAFCDVNKTRSACMLMLLEQHRDAKHGWLISQTILQQGSIWSTIR